MTVYIRLKGGRNWHRVPLSRPGRLPRTLCGYYLTREVAREEAPENRPPGPACPRCGMKAMSAKLNAVGHL